MDSTTKRISIKKGIMGFGNKGQSREMVSALWGMMAVKSEARHYKPFLGKLMGKHWQIV